MELKEAMAGSDEMLLRILCQTYGICHERELDLDTGAAAAVLITGALRFVVAMAKSHGSQDPEWIISRIRTMYGKQNLAIHESEDPGVRRWMETFKQTYGPHVPFAFSLRDGEDPLH